MEALAIEQATGAVTQPRSFASVLGESIRLVLASVFLFSGLSKLRAPYEFLAAVYGYELTGPLMSLVIATVLPWLEVITAICLWGKICHRGALAVAMLLTAVFTSVISLALWRQLDISCGCFSAEDKIGYSTLIRAASLLIASAIGLLLAIRPSRQCLRKS